MIVDDALSIWFCDDSMRKSTRANEDYIIDTQVECFYTLSHPWKTESWSFCEWIYFLTGEGKTTVMNFVFWKMFSYFFLVIQECKYISPLDIFLIYFLPPAQLIRTLQTSHVLSQFSYFFLKKWYLRVNIIIFWKKRIFSYYQT